MNLEQLIDKFLEKPYLLDMGRGSLSKMLGYSKESIVMARTIARNKLKYGTEYNPKDVAFNIKPFISNDLIIGDLH